MTRDSKDDEPEKDELKWFGGGATTDLERAGVMESL
jgi:hypothetical protein